MKTIKRLSLLMTILLAGFATNLQATTTSFTFEEEPYVNDIPFDTEHLKAVCDYEQALAQVFDFEEESYIDDIPFVTRCVTANCRYQKALKTVFNFEEEAYVDDIPFDTYTLFRQQTCLSLAR